MKSNAKRICLIVAIVFIVFFVGSTFLQIQNNKTNVDRSCSLILDQLEDVIDENEANINTLMETLKEEYLVRAKMISYMVEDHGESQLTAEEYQKLAEYASVDEIHLFDKNGTIVAGSNPEYYGYNFDSGEQMGYFKPMLRNKSKEMCQDVTENTAEKKPMMYAIVWASCEEHMVQIGISPSRLLKEMENSDISSLIDKIPVTEGMDVFLVDTSTGKIVSSINKKYVGRTGNSDSVEQQPLESKTRYFDQVEIGGEKYYVGYEKLDGYIVAISYAKNVANKDLPITMIILGITLLFAFILLSYVVLTSFQKMEESVERAERAIRQNHSFYQECLTISGRR